jgi:hypothetical protein
VTRHPNYGATRHPNYGATRQPNLRRDPPNKTYGAAHQTQDARQAGGRTFSLQVRPDPFAARGPHYSGVVVITTSRDDLVPKSNERTNTAGTSR